MINRRKTKLEIFNEDLEALGLKKGTIKFNNVISMVSNEHHILIDRKNMDIHMFEQNLCDPLNILSKLQNQISRDNK